MPATQVPPTTWTLFRFWLVIVFVIYIIITIILFAVPMPNGARWGVYLTISALLVMALVLAIVLRPSQWADCEQVLHFGMRQDKVVEAVELPAGTPIVTSPATTTVVVP